MKDTVRKLVQLQDIDSRIVEKSRFIEKVPLRISEVDAPLKQASQELDRIKQKNQELVKKRKDREKLLEETADKIKKMRARASEVKTNKEYQAHLKEIESAESEIGKIEEDILVAMVELDGAAKTEREKERAVQAEMGKINAFKRQLDIEVEDHNKELAALEQERAQLSVSIDPDVYSLYMRLMNTTKGVAVTAAQNEICMGCNMNIPPQLFVEIRKNEEIIQCPQCRRILYYPDDLPESSQDAVS